MEFSDAAAAAKSAFFCAALAVLLLMDRESDARARWAGLPLSDGLLSVEYWLRIACTRLQIALWLLLCAALLLLKCALFHRFWTCRGAHFEAERTRWACHLALSSLLVAVAALDRTTQRFDALVEASATAARNAAACLWRRIHSWILRVDRATARAKAL